MGSKRVAALLHLLSAGGPSRHSSSRFRSEEFAGHFHALPRIGDTRRGVCLVQREARVGFHALGKGSDGQSNGWPMAGKL